MQDCWHQVVLRVSFKSMFITNYSILFMGLGDTLQQNQITHDLIYFTASYSEKSPVGLIWLLIILLTTGILGLNGGNILVGSNYLSRREDKIIYVRRSRKKEVEIYEG